MSKRLTHRAASLIITDTLFIYIGLLLALYLRLGFEGATFQLYKNNGFIKGGLVTLVCLISLYFYELYKFTVINNRREVVLRMIQALGTAWVILVLIFYTLPTLEIGRGTSIYSVIITLVLLTLFRLLIHFVMGHPNIGERILIVGSGQNAIESVQAVLERRDAGYRIVGFIGANSENIETKLSGVQNIGVVDNLENIVQEKKIDRIVIAVHDLRGSFPTEPLLRLSLANKVSIEECTSFYERITGQVNLNMLRPSWLIFNSRPREGQLKTVLRATGNRGLGLIGLIVSFPIALLTAVLIKLESKGEIFYRQERVGKNGSTFEVLKFRSMKIDAEASGTPIWAGSCDDRTTRVGKVIRKIRVDEIPQFWNIIKGEMSFVGPRPERPHFVSLLAQEIPFYEHRHLVTPGLTGWAQIKYPYGASVEDARRKLQYDLYYIKNQSLVLDIVITFATIRTILFRSGAR